MHRSTSVSTTKTKPHERGDSMTIWIYGRENSSYMWGNLGKYGELDKALLTKLYGNKNLLCVMSDKSILTYRELSKAPKWHIKYGTN